MGGKESEYAENTKNQTKAKPIQARTKSMQCEIKSLQFRKFTFCKQRIEELDAALEVAEGKVLVEKSKSKVQLTPADIKKFLLKALKKEPRLMIKLLVKEVILYDDRVEVYYNCIDKKKPDDLDHRAFCIYRQDCVIDP